uniref:Uncharacterized protein n=1 Tax=Arundo donax TaxID=35708 RepID=A0A0A9A2V3_ARUDO
MLQTTRKPQGLSFSLTNHKMDPSTYIRSATPITTDSESKILAKFDEGVIQEYAKCLKEQLLPDLLKSLMSMKGCAF